MLMEDGGYRSFLGFVSVDTAYSGLRLGNRAMQLCGRKVIVQTYLGIACSEKSQRIQV